MPTFSTMPGKRESVMGEGFLLRLGVAHRRLLGAPSPTTMLSFLLIKAICQPLSQAL